MQMEAHDTPAVSVKGMGGGIRVFIDPDAPRDIIENMLIQEFSRLGRLATGARVVIDPGTRDYDIELIQGLSKLLVQSFRVASVTLPSDDKEANDPVQGDEQMQKEASTHSGDVMMIAGRVRSGQKITAQRHLVILGDLNPGAEAVAGGDIIVFGSLMGSASAGQPDNEDAIIAALDFRPTQVQIGGYVAAGSSSSKGRGPEYAHIEKNRLVVDDYVKNHPFKRLAMPQAR